MSPFLLLLILNLFCAITEGVYVLSYTGSVAMNLCAVVWIVTMAGNIAAASFHGKTRILSILVAIIPCILTMMNGMQGMNTDNQLMARQVAVIGFVYFLFSAFVMYRLHKESIASVTRGKSPIFVIIVAAILLVIALFMFLWYYSYTLIISEQTMSSSIAWATMLRIFLVVWIYTAALLLAGCLKSRGVSLPAHILIYATCILVVVGLIPSLSEANIAKNADTQYTRVFESDYEEYEFNLAEAVVGKVTTGYTTTTDILYKQMEYEGESYDLTFNMYAPEDVSDSLPVLIKIHGSGGSKGARNTALMLESIASQGYIVIDPNYGNEKVKPDNDTLATNVCDLLLSLSDHAEELHIDPNQIYLSGASRGGKMAMKVSALWANGGYEDLSDKVTIAGTVIYWGMMNDVFTREGDEKIISTEDITENFPPVLYIDVTNDGSVAGGNLLEGILYDRGVNATNIELRYGMHGASNYYYGMYGQLCEYYTLRFMNDVK